MGRSRRAVAPSRVVLALDAEFQQQHGHRPTQQERMSFDKQLLRDDGAEAPLPSAPVAACATKPLPTDAELRAGTGFGARGCVPSPGFRESLPGDL